MNTKLPRSQANIVTNNALTKLGLSWSNFGFYQLLRIPEDVDLLGHAIKKIRFWINNFKFKNLQKNSLKVEAEILHELE